MIAPLLHCLTPRLWSSFVSETKLPAFGAGCKIKNSTSETEISNLTQVAISKPFLLGLDVLLSELEHFVIQKYSAM